MSELQSKTINVQREPFQLEFYAHELQGVTIFKGGEPAKTLVVDEVVQVPGLVGEMIHMKVQEVNNQAMTATLGGGSIGAAATHSSKQANDPRDCWVASVFWDTKAILLADFS